MAEKATKSRATKAPTSRPDAGTEVEWEHPGGAHRIAIVQVLGLSEEPLTVRQIEEKVSRVIPVRDASSLEEQLQSLLTVKHVAKVKHRKVFELTESGRAMFESVRPFNKA